MKGEKQVPAIPGTESLSIVLFSKKLGCSFVSFDQTLTKFFSS